MNDSNNSSKGLLVLRTPQYLTAEQVDTLIERITPLADNLGVEPVVLDGGADARLEYGSSALLERVCVALEKIAAQGEPPVVSPQEGAPQALNARPSGLNSRPAPPTVEHVGLKAKPVCRGSWVLGTACGHCWRCEESRPNG